MKPRLNARQRRAVTLRRVGRVRLRARRARFSRLVVVVTDGPVTTFYDSSVTPPRAFLRLRDVTEERAG